MRLHQMVRTWWRLRLGRRVGLSIEVTDRCPLACVGCYMRWYPRNQDVSLAEWRRIVDQVPVSERLFCAWTGGEPLLRADVIAELSTRFAWNWVATSGTLPIPDLPRTTFFVSVDGPREIHDELRGGFSKIVEHVTPRCYIACTLRRQNCDERTLRAHVEFWRTRARGMVFSFLTPQRSHGGSLDALERRSVLDVLRKLRNEFGSFMVGTSGQLMDSATTAWSGRCPAESALTAFDASGRRKSPCTLGPDVDCATCGCAVPGFLRRVGRLHPSTLLEVVSLFR